eukprot:1995581-Prymnesium_polylepis.1
MRITYGSSKPCIVLHTRPIAQHATVPSPMRGRHRPASRSCRRGPSRLKGSFALRDEPAARLAAQRAEARREESQ